MGAASYSSGGSFKETQAWSPCAACKMLRRRCGEKCILAPYFPSTQMENFCIAHRVFGASNIVKLLQDLPSEKRADAVSSMVYESKARARDPVYGCAGIISHMVSQLSQAQTELTATHAEILCLRMQISKLVSFIGDNGENSQSFLAPFSLQPSDAEMQFNSMSSSSEGEDPSDLWFNLLDD